MHKIFIDGSNGTTGLRIRERLSRRSDLELLSLPEETRKDPAARKEILNACDVALLCLPDAAAVEAVEMIENPHVRVLDTSTAEALSAFQKLAGLPDNGELDKVTWKHLVHQFTLSAHHNTAPRRQTDDSPERLHFMDDM